MKTSSISSKLLLYTILDKLHILTYSEASVKFLLPNELRNFYVNEFFFFSLSLFQGKYKNFILVGFFKILQFSIFFTWPEDLFPTKV